MSKILTEEQIKELRDKHGINLGLWGEGDITHSSIYAYENELLAAQAEMSRAEESESSEISIQQAYEVGIETGEQRGREEMFVQMVECMWECDLLTREWYDSVFVLWRKEFTNHWAEWLVGCALELKAKLEKEEQNG